MPDLQLPRLAEAKNRVNQTKHRLIVLALLGLAFILSAFATYFFQFYGPLSKDPTSWGTFGDFIGGLLNPILSFFGLIALFYTIVLQQEELNYTRQEMAASKEELARSAAAQEQLQRVQAEQLRVLKDEEAKEDLFRLISTVYTEIISILNLPYGSNSKMRNHLERIAHPDSAERNRQLLLETKASGEVGRRLILLSHHLKEMRHLLKEFRKLSDSEFMIDRYKIRLGDVCDHLNAIGLLDAPTRDFFTMRPTIASRTDVLFS